MVQLVHWRKILEKNNIAVTLIYSGWAQTSSFELRCMAVPIRPQVATYKLTEPLQDTVPIINSQQMGVYNHDTKGWATLVLGQISEHRKQAICRCFLPTQHRLHRAFPSIIVNIKQSTYTTTVRSEYWTQIMCSNSNTFWMLTFIESDFVLRKH